MQKMKNDFTVEINAVIEQIFSEKCKILKQELISEIHKSLNSSCDKLSEIRAEKKQINAKSSYAEMAKRNANKIVIKPINNKNTKETKKALKKVIEPTEGLITTVTNINKGAIIVECKNSEAVEEVQKKVNKEIGQEYATEKLRETKKRRALKIVGLSTKLNDERIIECVKKQNDIEDNKELKIIKVYEDRNKREESYNIIIETDCETYEHLIEKKRIKVEWDSCRVFEHINVPRCFKCLGFQHKASDCTFKQACSKCGEQHDVKECNSNIIRCVNCFDLVRRKVIDVEVDHYAYSTKCPAYIRYLQSKKAKK
ncbi:uncharacterized protein PF3D7_1120000-like [Eurosta solidaginis]|uniref:uncharacterized protein PF3D7_1120000-like n=1 Tax=Eurosta solidaginis TaxID=178769 RepID=UPI003531472E